MWGCLQFLGEVFLIFWLLFRQSEEVWWCYLVPDIGTLGHTALLDCPILHHNAHIVPALSLGTLTSLLNFWTSKHRLILHRHTSKHVRKASPTVAWSFNTVTHTFSHPGHIFQLILCTLETSWAELGLSQAGTVSLELKLCLIGLASWARLTDTS